MNFFDHQLCSPTDILPNACIESQIWFEVIFHHYGDDKINMDSSDHERVIQYLQVHISLQAPPCDGPVNDLCGVEAKGALLRFPWGALVAGRVSELTPPHPMNNSYGEQDRRECKGRSPHYLSCASPTVMVPFRIQESECGQKDFI